MIVLDALEYLKNCSLYIWPGTYSVVKAKQIDKDCFATLIDQHEITLVQLSDRVNSQNVLEEEKEWRILTFEAVLPFELTGFLATIARVLADEGIAIFALSAYSTDHILVKDEHLTKAKIAMERLGVQV